MKIKLIFSVVKICIASLSYGQIIHIPADQPNIQAGIDAATNGDTVLVAEDTYYENIRFSGKAITLASEYILDADTNHINNTIIDGSHAEDPDSAATVMFIDGEDSTSIIKGFTIMGGGGLLNSSNLMVKIGGGIACINSGAKILNNKIIENIVSHSSYSCGGSGIGSYNTNEGNWIIVNDNTISNNTSISNSFSAFGGGIYLMNNAVIKNNIVERNTCINAGANATGGGIDIWDETGVIKTISVVKNIIKYNTVEGGSRGEGGAIAIFDVSEIKIMNNVIDHNIAKSEDLGYGGGICVSNSAIEINSNNIKNNSCDAIYIYGGGIAILNGLKSVISNNEIVGNILSADITSGGGVFIEKAADTIIISNNKINNNKVYGSGFGGGIGIFELHSEVLLMERNIISNNYSATHGGGLFTFNTYRKYINNNLFMSNKASNQGGAIRFRQYLGTVNFSRNEDNNYRPVIGCNNFIYNQANEGGAIYSDHSIETPIVINSIFWENNASTNQDCVNESNYMMVFYNNNIDTELLNSPWMGKDNINVNPDFVNDSIHLSWLSNCANAGIDSIEIEGKWYKSPTTDFDDDKRPYLNTKPDIGADEAPIIPGIYNTNDEKHLKLQASPNPFSFSTEIKFDLPQTAFTELKIYNLLGKEVRTIISEQLLSGKHSIIWKAENINSALYYVKVKSEGFSETIKLLHLK